MVGGDLSILKLSQKCFCYCTGTVQRTVALNRSSLFNLIKNNTIPMGRCGIGKTPNGLGYIFAVGENRGFARSSPRD